jgi:hypothetical protein
VFFARRRPPSAQRYPLSPRRIADVASEIQFFDKRLTLRQRLGHRRHVDPDQIGDKRPTTRVTQTQAGDFVRFYEPGMPYALTMPIRLHCDCPNCSRSTEASLLIGTNRFELRHSGWWLIGQVAACCEDHLHQAIRTGTRGRRSRAAPIWRALTRNPSGFRQ